MIASDSLGLFAEERDPFMQTIEKRSRRDTEPAMESVDRLIESRFCLVRLHLAHVYAYFM